MSTNSHRRMFAYTFMDRHHLIDPFFTLCEPCLDNIDLQRVATKWFVTQHPSTNLNRCNWELTLSHVFCLSCGHANEIPPGANGNFQVVRVFDATKQNTPAGLLFFADEVEISNMWFPDRAIRDQYFDEDVRPDMTAFFRDLAYREAQMEYELDDREFDAPMTLDEVTESLSIDNFGRNVGCSGDIEAIVRINGDRYHIVNTTIDNKAIVLRLALAEPQERDNGPK